MCASRRRHHHTPAGRTPIPADDLRASDAERDRAVSALRSHAGEGRLTVEELDSRIEAAFAARTRRELGDLLSDLPRERGRAPGGHGSPRGRRREFACHARSYVWVMALLIAIWALTGAGAFWPLWPALGWGVVLLVRRGSGRTQNSLSSCGPTTATASRSATSAATVRTSS
jgi:hypothetical protein